MQLIAVEKPFRLLIIARPFSDNITCFVTRSPSVRKKHLPSQKIPFRYSPLFSGYTVSTFLHFLHRTGFQIFGWEPMEYIIVFLCILNKIYFLITADHTPLETISYKTYASSQNLFSILSSKTLCDTFNSIYILVIILYILDISRHHFLKEIFEFPAQQERY